MPDRIVPPALPEDYFVAHFWQVIDGVEACYGATLNDAERQFITWVKALSPPALRLYIRLINRKGPYFFIDKLPYLEPGPLAAALDELAACAFLRPVEAEDCRDITTVFTTAQLQALLRPYGLPANMRKNSLCDWVAQHPDAKHLLQILLDKHPLVALQPVPWDFLKFLYFGRPVDNLSDFVVHDLGHVQVEPIDGTSLRPLFRTRRAAEDCYAMQTVYAVFRTVRDAYDAERLWAWWRELDLRRDALAAEAWPLFDRLAARLGRILERHRACGYAAAVYQASPLPAAQERLIRLKIKARQMEDAKALCLAALAHGNAEERTVLTQLLYRADGRKTATDSARLLKQFAATPMQWEDEAVEQAALKHFGGQGWTGVHSENWLWNSLFGLAFWDLIYDRRHGHYHNVLQTAPKGLFEPGYFADRQDEVETRLDFFSDDKAALAHLHKIHSEKQGLANPFVFWHQDRLDMAGHAVTTISARRIASVLRKMAADLGTWCHGFPDLFLWRGAEYKFVEVKSPTDRLQPQQFNWLRHFEECGIAFEIFRPVRSA